MLLPLLSLALSIPAAADRFEAPFRVSDAKGLIDVEIGHAAPLFTDFDADGLPDLLVGQFGGGKLRIYKNVGTPKEPRFEGFRWFQCGEELGTVPAS